MKQIKRLGIMKTSRIMAVLYFVYALIFAVPMVAMAVISGRVNAFLIIMPFLFAVLAFIIVAILCVIYNFLADKIGGIEIDIE